MRSEEEISRRLIELMPAKLESVEEKFFVTGARVALAWVLERDTHVASAGMSAEEMERRIIEALEKEGELN